MDRAILGRLLKKVPVFADIDLPLEDVVKRMALKSFEKDQDIFKKGEACDCLYIIILGRVLIYSTPATARSRDGRTAGQTDYFGEAGFFDGGRRPVGATALEKTVAFCLERADLFACFKENPQLAIKTIESLGKKLGQLTENAGEVEVDVSSNSYIVSQEADENQNTQASQTIVVETENNRDLSLSEILEKRLEEASAVDEGKEQETVEKEVSVADMLYNRKVVCPVCDNGFETPKVRSRYVRVKKIDNDFCKHYETINPLYYEIAVCPTCGFAFDEDLLNMKMGDEQKERIISLLTDVWQGRPLKDYSGERSLEQAIETFLLAVLASGDKYIKNSKKGMSFLKIAWLYRYKEDAENERKYIEKAAALLEHAYETESFADKRSEINIPFLIGVLNVRINKYHDAGRWLERVIRHPANAALPMILNRARELWGEVRQKLREEG